MRRNGLQPSVKPPLYGQIAVADIVGKNDRVQVQEVDLGIWNFSAYGIYECGKLSKYVLLNLDEWNSTSTHRRPVQRVTLHVPARADKAIVRRLTGPGANVETGVKWGGLEWNYAAGRLVQSGKDKVEKIKPRRGQLSVDIESSQCAVISFN